VRSECGKHLRLICSTTANVRHLFPPCNAANAGETAASQARRGAFDPP
jgi:hypothetical protein